MTRNIIFLAVIMFLTSLSVGVAAQEAFTAKVLTIEGQVEIRRQPAGQALVQPIAFKVEDLLRVGDTIVTGKNGRLVLGLSDGSQAVIAPKTTVQIDDLGQSPRNLFNVIKGKTRIQIEKLGGRPNPYRVNTPTAVIAVRGTIFDLLVDDDDTEVYLHEGQVEVTNRRIPNQLMLLAPGQMTRIQLQRPPQPPMPFRTGRNDNTFKPRINPGPASDNRRAANQGGPGGAGSRPAGASTAGGAPPRPGGTIPSRPDIGAPSRMPPASQPAPRPGGRRP